MTQRMKIFAKTSQIVITKLSGVSETIQESYLELDTVIKSCFHPGKQSSDPWTITELQCNVKSSDPIVN